MNLYRVYQNHVTGYDTYDSVIISAKTEEEAKKISLSLVLSETYPCWPLTTEKIQVELIGRAVKGAKSGIIVASFNAG